VREAGVRIFGQDFEADLDVFLELHPFPVLNELLGAALDLERRVVVLAIWVKSAANIVGSRCSQASL
jgi:hypothetical protein